MKTTSAILILICAVLLLGSATKANAQTSVPVYTTVVSDSWSYWEWDCYGWDYHNDYDWWWGPNWFAGADWYSGYDWQWTPTSWWNDYLYYYYCYYVYVEIWGQSLVQVPNTNANCPYSITVNFSDGSSQNFTQQGNGGAINLYFTHAAGTPVPSGATATENCGSGIVIISDTIATAATAQDTRPQIGIGEQVQCNLSNNASVLWTVTGAGSTTQNPATANTLIVATAAFTPGTMTVKATYLGTEYTKTFEVIAPSGASWAFLRDYPDQYNPIGNANIGAWSKFTSTILPTGVSFERAGIQGRFRESYQDVFHFWPNEHIPEDQVAIAGEPPFFVNGNNEWEDDSASGLRPINYLYAQGQLRNSNWSRPLELQFQDQASQWTKFKDVTHRREYLGSNKKARVLVEFGPSTSVAGSWMGPWQ